jgi:hypothetical protein
MSAVGDLADVVADKTGITDAVEKGKNFGLTPDQLRVKDMAPTIEKLQGNVDELQRRVDIASKTSSGYVPPELKSQLEAAQDKLRAKVGEAARVHPVTDNLARSLEAPKQTAGVKNLFSSTTPEQLEEGVARPSALAAPEGMPGVKTPSQAINNSVPQRGILKTPQELGLKPVTPEAAAAADANASAKSALGGMVKDTQTTLKPVRPVQGQSPLTETPGPAGGTKTMRPVTPEVKAAADAKADLSGMVKEAKSSLSPERTAQGQSPLTETPGAMGETKTMKPVTKTDLKPQLEKGLGVKEDTISSHPETAEIQRSGASHADATRITNSLKRLDNTNNFPQWAMENGYDMSDKLIGRNQGGLRTGTHVERAQVVKDVLTRMTPDQLETSVDNYLAKKK